MRPRVSAIGWFTILFAITALLALLIPPNSATLHLLHISDGAYRLFILTTLVPYSLIWFAAFYGYEQMEQYTHALRNTTEEAAFSKITNGLKIFAWGLMLSTILSLLLTIIRNNMPNFQSTQTIINHYAALVLSLLALTFVSDGAAELFNLVRGKHKTRNIRLLILATAVIGILFARFVVHNNSTDTNPYYLPLYPLLLTIVVPYIYAWTIGFIATIELRAYARKIKGVLYRRALQGLADGLTIVILVSIIVQYLTAAFTRGQMNQLSTLLILIYGLLAIEAAGFIMIALGAKRLRKIEEI